MSTTFGSSCPEKTWMGTYLHSRFLGVTGLWGHLLGCSPVRRAPYEVRWVDFGRKEEGQWVGDQRSYDRSREDLMSG